MWCCASGSWAATGSLNAGRAGHTATLLPDGKVFETEWAHVWTVDDASRIAFTDITPDQTAASAVAFLKAAVAYYASLGVTVSRVMTDNGPCYTAFAFRDACRELGLRHIRTRPYTPRTNGKAERFV